MEIETYDIRKQGTVKVFFKIIDDEVASVIIGNHAISTQRGYQFYVDDYVAEQIDKCELYIDGIVPKLRIKDGEKLIVPSEEEKRKKEIEELEWKLKELKGE